MVSASATAVVQAWHAAGVTIALLWRFKKLQEPVVIAAAAVIGVVTFSLRA